MIRIAAVGDIHMGPDSQGVLRPAFETLPDCADVLLLAGDLTRHGTPEEARAVSPTSPRRASAGMTAAKAITT